jgi:hypothetical protein
MSASKTIIVDKITHWQKNSFEKQGKANQTMLIPSNK